MCLEFLRFFSHSIKCCEWKFHTAETQGRIVGSGLHLTFLGMKYRLILCIICSTDVKRDVLLKSLWDKILQPLNFTILSVNAYKCSSWNMIMPAFYINTSKGKC